MDIESGCGFEGGSAAQFYVLDDRRCRKDYIDWTDILEPHDGLHIDFEFAFPSLENDFVINGFVSLQSGRCSGFRPEDVNC